MERTTGFLEKIRRSTFQFDMTQNTDIIEMYAIYENPKDAPGKFVVRRWEVSAGKVTPKERVIWNTLAEARASVSNGRTCIPRKEADDPCVVETWL